MQALFIFPLGALDTKARWELESGKSWLPHWHPEATLFLAAQAYKIYHQRGGTKASPLPDFFIGAHAARA